jgi:hypothetical protein
MNSATGAHQTSGTSAMLRVLADIATSAAGTTTLDSKRSAICPENGAIRTFGTNIASRIIETPVGPTASLSRRITAKVVSELPM